MSRGVPETLTGLPAMLELSVLTLLFGLLLLGVSWLVAKRWPRLGFALGLAATLPLGMGGALFAVLVVHYVVHGYCEGSSAWYQAFQWCRSHVDWWANATRAA